MTPRVRACALVIGLAVVLASPQVRGDAPAPAQTAATAETAPRALLDQYCVSCHNQRVKTGGLALDGLDPEHVGADAATWEKVLRKLQLGVMPPLGAKRPDDRTYDRLIAALAQRLDDTAGRHDPGRTALHRVNRAEYANAIRDLLGIQVDVSALLPPDNAAFGFDNVADALGNSPALMEAYLSAARKISAVAVGNPTLGAGSETHSVRQDLSQDHYLDGLPLGTIGGLAVNHTFPVDGEYEFQIKLYRTNLNAIRGLDGPHRIELTVDGERILLADIGGRDDLVAVQQNPTAASDALESGRLRVRHVVKAGQRPVMSAFLDETSIRLATNRLQRFVRDFNPYDAEGAPHVQSITVSGPFKATAWTPVSTRLFSCGAALPSASPEPRVPSPARVADDACARRILTTVGRRAYRRTLTGGELDTLMRFYASGRRNGPFEAGIEAALRFVLASPAFVFRPEREPEGIAAGATYRLDDVDLASRLSFFLWSSIPDEDLLDAAERGQLHEPAVLARQVRRLLADPRAEAFVTNFAGQWLQLRNLKGIVPNSDLFPDFDDNLRQAFRREAELFVDSIVREDRSVLDLMTADYTFVNDRLARHYGIPGVIGNRFRRVTLTTPQRFGLLGKGAVLLVTSHANTTSPVLRGKWVLENVLGAPPPPPPPDVPALNEQTPGTAPRTMREQMEQHRADPVCAGCHKTMDPIGFALENFDAVGAWHTADETGAPLNTTDVMADGSRIDGVVALRAALLKRPELFVQTLTEKLMVYALGRGLTHDDMPIVRRIVADARGEGYRFSALIGGIVNSVPFQWRAKPSGGQTSGRVASAH